MIGGSDEWALSIDNRTAPRQSRKWPRTVLRTRIVEYQIYQNSTMRHMIRFIKTLVYPSPNSKNFPEVYAHLLQFRNSECKMSHFVATFKDCDAHWGKNPQFIRKFIFWKSHFSPDSHFFKVSFFTKFTFSKFHFSQNSNFQNLIFYKIHIFKISFFTKFTFSKSQFS